VGGIGASVEIAASVKYRRGKRRPPMSAVVENNAIRTLPLAAGDGARPLVFGPGGPVALGTFLGQARALAARLPEARHAILLCEDRYRFLLGFCAAALRGQAVLLPPSRAPGCVADIAARHPGSHCIGDDAIDPCIAPLHDGAADVGADALAVVGFTSGSTGTPAAHAKTWGAFHASTTQNVAALRHLWPAGDVAHLVATVPPQHMYGMELSVLLPLFADVAVHAGRPFFPHDIVRALHEAPAPRLLVTTPVHLRALLDACAADASLVPPPLAGVVSATAPLPASLAAAAEARLDCEAREFFGSTETCVIASRRTARDDAWTPFPGVRLQPRPGGTDVHAPHLPVPVTLADLVALDADGRFVLCGRDADLLEIAGKRASLGDLTRRLQSVEGVEDGVVFQLDADPVTGVRRLAALAVAPGLDEARILDALRDGIDPVFLPRPLRRVAALPRNATGKLPRADLLAALRDANA
jgi:acyl-coenzyme A synthetase/AMP-(fatty) acid ligase